MDINDIKVEDLQNNKYQEIFPDLYFVRGLIEFGPWHKNQDLFDHILKDYKYVQQIIEKPHFEVDKQIKLKKYLQSKIDNHTREELLKLMVIYHDTGKKQVFIKTPNATLTPGHQLVSVYLMKQNKKLKGYFDLTDKELNIIYKMISLHDFISDVANIYEYNKDSKLLDIFSEIAVGLNIELAIFILADLYGSDLDKIDKNKYLQREKTLKYFLEYFLK